MKLLLQAKSDTIDSLEAYRERSEPTFLMYSVKLNALFYNYLIGDTNRGIYLEGGYYSKGISDI